MVPFRLLYLPVENMARNNIYARKNLSLLCWNIDGKNNVETMKYMSQSKADLYFIQEVGDSFKWPSNLEEEYGGFSSREVIGSCNCIIYKKDSFEVCKVIGESRGEKKQIHCAAALGVALFGEETQPWDNLQFDEKNKLIKAVKSFAEKDKDKRVCVAILQYKHIQSKPKIIVASCHVQRYLNNSQCESPKRDSIKDYAKAMLGELEELGQDCPIIAAGDFNCDIIKNIGHNFIVPQYNPTIHRVVCSGGNGKPCIDFFAYKNKCDRYMVEVNDVSAEIVWLKKDNAQVLKNWDKCTFPLYQQHLAKISALDVIPSVHDPLIAKLNIDDISSPTFNLTYCDLTSCNLPVHDDENVDTKMTFDHFNKLFPRPDLCIFQNVSGISTGFVKRVHKRYNEVLYGKFYLLKITDNCFIIYDTGKFKFSNKLTKAIFPIDKMKFPKYRNIVQGETHNIVEFENWTTCICTIECHSVKNQPRFQIAIFNNSGTPQKQKHIAKPGVTLNSFLT